MQPMSELKSKPGATPDAKIESMRIFIPEEDKRWILERFSQVLDSRILTNGDFCAELERKLAEYMGVKHAIATNSGTGALEAMLRALALKGEIIVTPETFSATIYAILRAGCKPVFADVDQDMSLDPDRVREKLTKNTAAIMTVHIGGHISERVWELKEIASNSGIPLLEDSAHAIGSKLDNTYAGTIGQASGFSFFPTKVIGSAEGGFIATNDSNVAEQATLLRDQGKKVANWCVVQGYNWRMSEFQAIIAISQLRHLEEFIARRNQIAEKYSDLLDSKVFEGKITGFSVPKGARPNWYKYIAFLRNQSRDSLKAELKERAIAVSGEVYEVPCHTQPAFQDLGYKEGDFPVAEEICRTHVCFPLMASLTDSQVRYFCETLPSCLS